MQSHAARRNSHPNTSFTRLATHRFQVMPAIPALAVAVLGVLIAVETVAARPNIRQAFFVFDTTPERLWMQGLTRNTIASA